MVSYGTIILIAFAVLLQMLALSQTYTRAKRDGNASWSGAVLGAVALVAAYLAA